MQLGRQDGAQVFRRAVKFCVGIGLSLEFLVEEISKI
jgi:hypothetical protein